MNAFHRLPRALVVLMAVVGMSWVVSGAADEKVVRRPQADPPAATQAEEATPSAALPRDDVPIHVAEPVQTAELSGEDLIQSERDFRAIRWQRTQTAVADYMERARKAMLKPKEQLTVDDFTQARQLVNLALSTLRASEDVAPAAEHQALLADLRSLDSALRDKEQRWNEEQVLAQQKEAAERERRRVIEVQERQRRRIDELLDQAHAATQEKNYKAAIRVLEEVLNIQPNHKQATWMRQDLQIQDTLTTQQRQDDEQSRWTGIALNNAREALTPYDNPIVYPPAEVWHRLSEARRNYEAGLPPEPAANLRVRDLLQKNVPEIRFQAITFENALNFLRDLQRVNINPNWGAMEALGITRATEVTLQLRDVTFETALKELLAKVAGREDVLDYMIREGVIKVSSKEDLATIKYILVYDVRDLLHPLEDFRVPSLSRQLSRGGGDDTTGGLGGGGGGAGGLFGGGGMGGEPTGAAVGQDRETKVKQFLDLMRMTVLPDTWAPTGDANVTETDGLLVVKQTANGHRELARLLQQLREHSKMQITIETRFLTIESDFLEDIGMNLNFIFNRNALATDRTGNIPLSFGPADLVGDGVFSRTGGTGFSSLQPVGNADIFQVSRSTMAIAGSFLDDLQVDFFLRATQAHRQSNSLNALRVTLMNGHEAYVLVAEQRDYVSDLSPTVAASIAAYRPGISQLTKGMSFGVRATVSADRRYVIMTVWPTLKDETIAGEFSFAGSILTTTTAGTTVIGGTAGTAQEATASKIQLGRGIVQEVRTTVMVPDQGTLLLGGQRKVQELELETGVPMLSKIPVLKRFFTTRSFVKQELTLLILIRPQIIIPEEWEP